MNIKQKFIMAQNKITRAKGGMGWVMSFVIFDFLSTNPLSSPVRNLKNSVPTSQNTTQILI